MRMLEESPRAVGGSVVYHHDLLRGVVLGEDSVERAGQDQTLVSRRDEHGERRPRSIRPHCRELVGHGPPAAGNQRQQQPGVVRDVEQPDDPRPRRIERGCCAERDGEQRHACREQAGESAPELAGDLGAQRRQSCANDHAAMIFWLHCCSTSRGRLGYVAFRRGRTTDRLLASAISGTSASAALPASGQPRALGRVGPRRSPPGSAQ